MNSSPHSPQLEISHSQQWRPNAAKKLKKNSDSIKCWQGCIKTGSLRYCCWKCKLIEPLQKTVWHFLMKPNIQLTCDPTIALFYPRKMKVYVRRKIWAGMLIAASLYSQYPKLETTWCQSFNYWVFTQTVVPPLCGFLLSNKKAQLLIQSGWILRRIMLHKPWAMHTCWCNFVLIPTVQENHPFYWGCSFWLDVSWPVCNWLDRKMLCFSE